jgi:threonine aldolase
MTTIAHHEVDLRSDTVTRPTPAMRRAIAEAEVGDDQRGEDPTVSRLEQRIASLLAKEAAVFLPSATMGNHIAACLHGRPGDELVAEAASHVLVFELGGAAVHARMQTRGIAGERGMVTREQIVAVAHPEPGPHRPRTAVVVLENTHNVAGGAILPQGEVACVGALCRELGVALHLDGARLFNAAVALRRPVSELAGPFDTVTLCLSKGLGCPVGALIAGSQSHMAQARRLKHMLGGAMRQAGILAAAGLYALEHHVERLAEDHARAARLAHELTRSGVAVIEPERVATNFVQIETARHGLSGAQAIERLGAVGIGLSATPRIGVIRALTHLDVDDRGIDLAIARIPGALGVC